MDLFTKLANYHNSTKFSIAIHLVLILAVLELLHVVLNWQVFTSEVHKGHIKYISNIQCLCVIY